MPHNCKDSIMFAQMCIHELFKMLTDGLNGLLSMEYNCMFIPDVDQGMFEMFWSIHVNYVFTSVHLMESNLKNHFSSMQKQTIPKSKVITKSMLFKIMQPTIKVFRRCSSIKNVCSSSFSSQASNLSSLK